METSTTEMLEPIITRDPAERSALVLAAGAVGAGMAGGRNEICFHEAGHATVDLATGTHPATLAIFVSYQKGWVSHGATEGDRLPDRSDEERLASLAEVQAICDQPKLDLAAINREAEAILREHGIFLASLARCLEERLERDGNEARMTGDELSFMWMCHQIRTGV